jgi:molybdopterin synthase sulfur carrier subunit
LATVKLFGTLRVATGKSSLILDGSTILELLTELVKQHESLATTILSEEGLQPYFKIMLNGHDIFLAQGLHTPVQPGDMIAIFPPIAGGER